MYHGGEKEENKRRKALKEEEEEERKRVRERGERLVVDTQFLTGDVAR